MAIMQSKKMLSKITALAAVLLSPCFLFSQGNLIQTTSVALQWEAEARTLTERSLEKYYMYFEGAFFDEAEMLPIKTLQINLPEYSRVRVELQNAQFEPISNNIGQDWGQDKLSNQVNFRIDVSFNRRRPMANISFVPIRKNESTGQYERLISGELRIYASPDEEYALTYNTLATRNSTNSNLGTGRIYKIAIPQTGVYKIDYNFLQSLGVDVNNIDPRNIQILGNGGYIVPEIAGSASTVDDINENAIWVQGESDGSFDAGDYILFYANGPKYWVYSTISNIFVHIQNIYTKEAYYFIKIAATPGKRIGTRASLSGTAYTTSSYDALLHHEEDDINLMNKEFSLPPSGRLWVGNPFQINRTQSFHFPFQNRIASEPVRMRASLFARNFGSVSTYNITANGAEAQPTTTLLGVNPYIYGIYAREGNALNSFTTSGNAIDVSVSYNHSSSSSEAWLDYITLNARCNLIYTGSQMRFRDLRAVGSGSATYQVGNVVSGMTIWDVTYPFDVQQQAYTGSGTISFGAPADTLREFVIFGASNHLTPTAIGPIANQNLHSITTAPNLLIVYHKDFESAAMRLASHRANHSNMTVLAVDIAQIYNEFSSGNPDISAVRNFTKMLYDRSSGQDSLRYLLLFGGGSYDYKGNNQSAVTNPDFVITYQTAQSIDPLTTYTTDDFFALLDNGEGNVNANNYLDIAVGRLPVRTAVEADNVVDKIIRYDSDPATLGDWRNRLSFLADDQDGNLHLKDAEDIAQYTASTNLDYNVDKIYADAYQQISTSGGSRYPDVNDAILRNIFKGNLSICYLGHGGADGLAQERIFTSAEINTLTNEDKMPLFVTATCSFAPFDDPAYTSAGELLILNPNGGAAALLTTVRVVLADANKTLTQKTFEKLFTPVGDRMPTIGEVLQNAKNAIGNLSASNTRKYVLLGDPSMTLAYPEFRVATSTINAQTITGNDTIRALDFVTITGEVQDLNGSLMSSFNGTLYPTVFDKPDTIATRANDPDSQVKRFPLQKKVIFKGRASVVNGRFTFSFIVPIDINYRPGYGKISYYADNGTIVDANGNYQGIVIGGTNPNAASDDQGPIVDVYMNNEDFASGGITDNKPLLLVKLSDDSGINTVGNGIGHDLTGILTFIQDGKEVSYNLNDFYEANMDDFTAGKVNYPLKDLPEGPHTAHVKAWDVYNNMGEGMTEFVVASNAEMALDHVLNYPNPFTTHTEFMFEHNLPYQELDVLVQIYTVSGKLIKTIKHNVSAAENNGYRITGIDWDGLDEYGDRIGRGAYIYKVTVRATGPAVADSESPAVKQSSEYQKLVILR